MHRIIQIHLNINNNNCLKLRLLKILRNHNNNKYNRINSNNSSSLKNKKKIRSEKNNKQVLNKKEYNNINKFCIKILIIFYSSNLKEKNFYGKY